MTATLRSPFNLSAHLRPTVGDQKMTYVGVDHMGWMLCDGRSLSTTDYGLLFGVIGYSFDTSLIGTSSFRLPNPAGRVIGVAGAGSTLTERAIGSNVGAETHTLIVAEMPTHNHTGTTDSNNSNVVASFANQTNDTTNVISTRDTYGKDLAYGTHTHTFTTSNAGSNQPHNNMQPTLFAGNMFIYSGRNMDAYFPYTWVGGEPAPDGTAPTPGKVLIW
jgi:microcystin-dependent protein